MDLKKPLLALGIVFIALAVVSFTQSINQKGDLSVYYDGALVKETRILEKEDSLELPSGVIESSFYVKGGSPLIEFSLIKRGELQNNIGEEVIVFFKNKEIRGKLIDYKNGKAYIKSGEGITVITPEGFVLKNIKSTTTAMLKFENSPGESIISYLTNRISWKGNHKVFLGEDKLLIESFAVISNNDEKEYEGEVKLYTKSINNYYYSPPVYYVEKRALAVEEVKKEEKETTLEFNLGNRKIEPKSKLNILIERGEIEYNRISTFTTYYNSNFKGKLRDSINFKAPYAMPGGEVYIYSDFFEGKVNMKNKAKGENVELMLGEDMFLEGENRVVSIDYVRDREGRIKKETVESIVRLVNRGDNEKEVEVIVNMPFYAEWEVLSSSVEYEKSQKDIRYRLSLKGGEEKEIKLKVRVNYDK